MRYVILESLLIAMIFIGGSGLIHGIDNASRNVPVFAQGPVIEAKEQPSAVWDSAANSIWTVFGSLGGAWVIVGYMMRKDASFASGKLNSKMTFFSVAVLVGIFGTPFAVVYWINPHPGRELCGFGAFLVSAGAWGLLEIGAALLNRATAGAEKGGVAGLKKEVMGEEDKKQ
jgi:hypothetical protein